MAIAPAAALAAPAVAEPLSAWDRALRKYRRAMVMFEATEQYGKFKHLGHDLELAREKATQNFGHWRKADKETAAELDRLYEREDAAWQAAYQLYCVPACNAAIELLLTPAPDVDAVMYKMEVAKTHELDNHTGVPDVFDVIKDDWERLRY